MKLLSGADAWHWSTAGLVIGAVTLGLLWIANRRLGVSGGFDDICAIASDLAYFRPREPSAQGQWRLIFLVGLLVGGALSAISTGTWAPTWDLGSWDETIGGGPAAKIGWMFAGGILIGFGTRLAGGCTSGHGIFGVANFEWASWRTMMTFMATGIATTQLIRAVFG